MLSSITAQSCSLIQENCRTDPAADATSFCKNRNPEGVTKQAPAVARNSLYESILVDNLGLATFCWKQKPGASVGNSRFLDAIHMAVLLARFNKRFHFPARHMIGELLRR